MRNAFADELTQLAGANEQIVPLRATSAIVFLTAISKAFQTVFIIAGWRKRI